MSVGVVLSSAFSADVFDHDLEPVEVEVEGASVSLLRWPRRGEDAYVLYRHGHPHRLLPHQLDYRAHARAFERLGCRSVLLTSSVGVLAPDLPLNVPMLVGDLWMPENRLPDGSACTVFEDPSEGQGHLVIEDGLFSSALNRELERIANTELRRVSFAYIGGPRTKSGLENRLLAQLGLETNSMSIGPEAVLLNELEICVAALVVGHKRSGSSAGRVPELARTLHEARCAMERIVRGFLDEAPQPAFANTIYRF